MDVRKCAGIVHRAIDLTLSGGQPLNPTIFGAANVRSPHTTGKKE